MNCKPGDLAIIIGNMLSPRTENVGKIVKVIKPWGDGLSWLVSAEGSLLVCADGFRHRSLGVFDRDMRPLPGDEKPKAVERDKELIA